MLNRKLSFLKLFLCLSMLPMMSSAQKESDHNLQRALERHDKAVRVFGGTMRDPFVTLAPDGYYYLACTRPLKTFPNSLPGMQFFRSKDLVIWEKLSPIWEAKDSEYGRELMDAAAKRNTHAGIWAPEVHFIDGRWVVVNTSNMRMANILVTKGTDLTGPYTEPMGLNVGFHRDPTIFVDDDGTKWMLTDAVEIHKLKPDFSDFDGFRKLIGPSDRILGHEGVFVTKIGSKYVMFGTGWSTDNMRRGTYNLYYCVADQVTGPYGPRQFAGRYLGHGNLFQDKKGRWWCTAFYNADHPTLTPEEAATTDMSNSAYTINKGGLTLVPMEVYEKNGQVVVRAKDEAYRYPGEDEVQKFGIK